MGIRIDALPATALPSLAHEFPAMLGGLTVKLTLEQIRGLIMAAGGTIGGDISVKKIGPVVELWDTAGGANLKRARFITTGNTTVLQVLNDDGTLKATGFTISHTTGVVTFGARPVFGAATPWDDANLPATAAGKAVLNAGDAAAQRVLLETPWRTILRVKPNSAVALADVALPAGTKAIRVEGAYHPSVVSASLYMRLSFDNGVTFKAGGSDYSYSYLQQLGTGITGGGSTSTNSLILTANADSINVNTLPFKANFSNGSAVDVFRTVSHSSGYNAGANQLLYHCLSPTVGAATNLRFFASSGNLDVGTDFAVEVL